MKVIDLLNMIANGEELPKKIKYSDCVYTLQEDYGNYGTWQCDELDLLNDIILGHFNIEDILGFEIEVIEDNDDLELIPDDELYLCQSSLDIKVGIAKEIDFNFRVLKDKINELVKEINEIRKEMK